MIYQNLEFHNVIDLQARDGFSGLQLQRFPEAVRNQMSPRGRWNAQMTPGSEIRLVTSAGHIRLFVSALEGDAELMVFNGDFQHSVHYLEPGAIKCIHVNPIPRLDEMKDEAFAGQRFNKNVWRFFFSGYQTMFHQIETYGHDYRPPIPEEKPALRWLAYGSSISAGCGSARAELSYVQLTARRLGVDVMNMAQGGACMCEKETADFFAERGDWDFATYEIGVNMLEFYSPEVFKERASYLVNTTLEKNPDKPLVLITSFLNYSDVEKEQNVIAERLVAYNDILREMVDNYSGDNLYLVEGKDCLIDFDALTVDLIHPGSYGHIQMAENLSRELMSILPGFFD
jgi:lysophospholipase L1-like esterase